MFVEDTSQFTKGINLIYVNHVSLAVLTEPENNNNLKVYCFAQEYLDSSVGLVGQQIIDKAATSLNVLKDKVENAANEWYFYRCSVDLTLRRAFINEQPEVTLNAESLYKGKQNFETFKYFKFPTYTALRIENAAQNTKSRSFLKRICAYRDYMPLELWAIRYRYILSFNYNIHIRKMIDYTGHYYYPLVFAMDTEEWPGNVGGKKPYYGYGGTWWFDFPNGKYLPKPVYYTYPKVYQLTVCTGGNRSTGDNLSTTNTCSGGGGCGTNGKFCLGVGQEFWCAGNTYLGIIRISIIHFKF